MFWQRRLPHWVPNDSIVFVTSRLAGTLPQPPPGSVPDPATAFVIQDCKLDSLPYGPHWLKDPRIAKIVVASLLHGENVRRAYNLLAWVIMPNHIHVVLRPRRNLPEIVRWLKTATAVRANRLLSKTSPFWQREYYDHWIRDRNELSSVINYVEENPVNAGLVRSPADWPWSSASQDTGGKTAGATA